MQYKWIPIMVVGLYLSACSRAFDPEVRTGTMMRMAEGEPVVLLSAIAFVDDDNLPVVDVDLEIMYGSLIYREREGVFKAEIDIRIELLRIIEDSEGEFESVQSVRETVDVSDTDRSIITSRQVLTIKERLQADPGRYVLTAQVTDLTSDKSVRRRTNVTVYDPESKIPSLTHIRVLGRSNRDNYEDWPVTSYSIPGSVDSLTFEYQVIRPEGSAPLSVRMRLVRFESDTLPPRSMSSPTPAVGSLQYRGINYSRREVLESQERILEQETGTITIEYTIRRPSRGNYRFEVNLSRLDEEDDEEWFKARDFSSMSTHFPQVLSYHELAKPLIYLMRLREYRRIMEIEERDLLKNQIDRFWLSNIGDKSRALQVIEMYYDRVEQANKQFTTFKEGWMTDMGMVYILFGPPYYVERSLDTMIWVYGYDRMDASRVFYFRRTRSHSDHFPFEHYILQRHYQYHNVEYEQIQRWLTGTILTRPI